MGGQEDSVSDDPPTAGHWADPVPQDGVLSQPVRPQERFSSPFRDPRVEYWLLALYASAAIVVTIQRGIFSFPMDYAIFRASFWNLVEGRDLYLLRPDQGFKYSPTFALLFAPFALLRFAVGLLLWNLVNAISMFFAFKSLLPGDQARIALALVFLPMLRSMQSSQSNALVAALLIFAFVCFELGRQVRGAFAIAIGAAIKIFPLAAVVFVLSHPRKARALALCGGAVVVIILLPLFVISPGELLGQYRSWATLQGQDAVLLGSSVIGLLREAGVLWPAWVVQLAACGIVVGVLLARHDRWAERSFQLQYLAFVLVFCVLFNHRAERQSSVIAISGLIIWILVAPRAGWRTALFVVVYSLVTLIGADVTPQIIKRALSPDARSAIPLTFAWLAILWDLVRTGRRRPQIAEVR
jgi:glycosyl transferase family 87